MHIEPISTLVVRRSYLVMIQMKELSWSQSKCVSKRKPLGDQMHSPLNSTRLLKILFNHSEDRKVKDAAGASLRS